MSRRLVPFAALLVALAPAALALPNALFVPADGDTVSATVPEGATARVTVAGVYAYSLSGGLADCRHYTYPNPLTWYAGGRMLWFDDGQGARAFPCGSYSPSHVYSVTIVGTGEPIVFWINDSNHGDNAGGLVVTIE